MPTLNDAVHALSTTNLRNERVSHANIHSRVPEEAWRTCIMTQHSPAMTWTSANRYRRNIRIAPKQLIAAMAWQRGRSHAVGKSLFELKKSEQSAWKGRAHYSNCLHDIGGKNQIEEITSKSNNEIDVKSALRTLLFKTKVDATHLTVRVRCLDAVLVWTQSCSHIRVCLFHSDSLPLETSCMHHVIQITKHPWKRTSSSSSDIVHRIRNSKMFDTTSRSPYPMLHARATC